LILKQLWPEFIILHPTLDVKKKSKNIKGDEQFCKAESLKNCTGLSQNRARERTVSQRHC
jgi:hypothetical protein